MIHLTVNPPGRSRNVTRSYYNRRSNHARKHAGSPIRREQPTQFVHRLRALISDQICAVAGDLRQQRQILEEFLSAGPLPADVITTALASGLGLACVGGLVVTVRGCRGRGR
jgi:hypothetical protein